MAEIIITILTIVGGSLLCFEGYKLFRMCLGIIGGVAGFALGNVILSLIESGGAEVNGTVRMVVIALFTIGLAVTAFSLYMKALIAISTVVCGYWFYEDFDFLYERMTDEGLRIAVTIGSGIIAGFLIGVIVYYAQRWTISLFTAFIGARMISGVLSPVLWSCASSNEYVGILGQKALGDSVGFNYPSVQLLVVVAFCVAGYVIQLKTKRK
ncbi:MAG: hypothetical protein MJ084_00645 [Saccharofermentans sp.]|nr:hypothetical protein [Saccharofermentans sp.]